MTDLSSPGQPPRTRDPERSQKILAAAARLFAAHGFHPVSLADIGRDAGVVGSGIYRHFDNKVAVLVALLDQAMSDLMTNTEELLESSLPPDETMLGLIETQIQFCLEHGLSVQLYRSELTALSEEDARRLRRLQRRYNEEWVSALLEVRPDLNEETARGLVHAAIGAIQSLVTYSSELAADRRAELLRGAARRCLGL